MNDYTRRMMYDRARRDRDYAMMSGRDGRRDRGVGNYTFGGYGEYDRSYDDYAHSDYADMDYRRGGYRDRTFMDYGRRDYDDYGEMQLTRKEKEKWKREMMNEDGSRGEHFSKEQCEQSARQVGVNPDEFESGTFCLAMNMMYSDYCKTAKKYGVDRPDFYADLAKDFLKDKDFDGDGDEKLALYYKCVVCQDE